MGCFGYYSDTSPCAKTMRGNGITNFLLHVVQCITFNKYYFTATLIAKASLKSIYSRLGFKVFKYFATSTHFEKDRKRFNYESVKSNASQKTNWLTMLSNHPTMCYNSL